MAQSGHGWSCLRNILCQKRTVVADSTLMIELDDIDHHILDLLSEDGRMANVDLADQVGLSPSPCLRRVRRLEDAGVIRGYRADIHPDAQGRGFLAFGMVTLTRHDKDVVDAFERAILEADGVIECHHLAGTSDYLIRVEVADLAAYDRFSRHVAAELPGLGALTTHVVLSSLGPR